MVRIWISSHFIPLPFFSFFLAIHVAVAAFVGWCLATFLEESFNQPEMAEFLGHLKLGRNGHLPNLSHVLYGIHPLNQSRHFRENNLVELIESLRINLYDLYGWWYFFWCFNQIKNHHQIERVINHQPINHQETINLYQPLSHVAHTRFLQIVQSIHRLFTRSPSPIRVNETGDLLHLHEGLAPRQSKNLQDPLIGVTR